MMCLTIPSKTGADGKTFATGKIISLSLIGCIDLICSLLLIVSNKTNENVKVKYIHNAVH